MMTRLLLIAVFILTCGCHLAWKKYDYKTTKDFSQLSKSEEYISFYCKKDAIHADHHIEQEGNIIITKSWNNRLVLDDYIYLELWIKDTSQWFSLHLMTLGALPALPLAMDTIGFTVSAPVILIQGAFLKHQKSYKKVAKSEKKPLDGIDIEVFTLGKSIYTRAKKGMFQLPPHFCMELLEKMRAKNTVVILVSKKQFTKKKYFLTLTPEYLLEQVSRIPAAKRNSLAMSYRAYNIYKQHPIEYIREEVGKIWQNEIGIIEREKQSK